VITRRPSAMATGIVEWAERAPERPAFVAVGRTLALDELDHEAAALAARLLDGPDATPDDSSSWLPVVVDRSLDSTVAVHGAVRAGLRWTPLEATSPPELVAQLWARLGSPSRAVVAQPEYAALLPAGVEAIAAHGHQSAGSAEPQLVDPDAPGVVLFTSGTTGRPKGVVRSWASIDARVERARNSARGDTEGFVQPFGFAPGIRVLALPSVGRTLCVADPSSMSVDELLDFLAAQRVDSVAFPPSLTAAILRVAGDRPRLPTVSLFRLGAEASDWSLVAPLRRLTGAHVTIRTSYSTTECGVIAQFVVEPDDPIGSGRIPLGHLQRNVEVRLEPVDDDPATSELLVANPKSFGYLGEPELTARRFVTDDDGVQWFKTGDLVELDADRVYHHRGRVDELVKVHGMFVAPSRLEEELRMIDGVGAAAAIATTTIGEHVVLSAHVQVDDDSLTPEQVETHLRARLPRHLIPAILVRHDELPRSDRQKIDRRALERAPLVRWRAEPARLAATDLERWVLGKIQLIVALDDIGPDDDLFAVGLDSLSVLELCAALTDAGLGDVDPAQVLEARTCARLCAVLERKVPPASSAVVALNGAGTQAPIFVLPGGGATAMRFRLLAECLGPDRPMLVIEARGMHRGGSPDRTILAMAEHAREEVEARLGPDDPCLLVGYSASGTVAYETAQQMHAAGRPVHLMLLDAVPGRPGNRSSYDRGVTVRSASRRELPAAVARSLQYRWELMPVLWFERVPGAPRHYNPARYRAFARILSRASRSYEPLPAAFPTTLVHIGKDDLVARAEALVPNLSLVMVDGDHFTMLLMPEVLNLAAVVAAWADAAALPVSQ